MSIYDHFRPEEAVFVDKVLEWKDAAEHYHKVKLTDFLDPREQQIISMLIGAQADAAVAFSGAAPQAERRRALIYPAYLQPLEEEFQLQLLEVEYPAKFYTIEHRQVLGALMSLGLKREKYGDILIQDERAQIVAAREVSDYIAANLQSIGRAKVTVKAAKEAIQLTEVWEENTGTVSSLRLDVLAAELFNVSRQKIQTLIKGGVVKVNWKVVEQTSYECFSGDMLSVRGYGRGKLMSVDGKSKKDKWKISYGLLK
ncbi:RNA-binding protein [Ectobacillus ponti]|uniref:RNA-binding protein n=1 Tax=Ectobacillus ponti TaxID=2961894 RepID=A0AA41X795_9BACI|nr:RNA-binding protein [Ectobacillus ponti]MCP8970229.1 RNA-binding protein [Ectobacillus ponti]